MYAITKSEYRTPSLCSDQRYHPCSSLPISHSPLPAHYQHLVLLAPSQANIDILSKVGRDSLPELFNVLAIDGIGETKGCVNDVGIESEEILCDLAGTGVFGVQSSNKCSLVAIVVELEVNGALREDGAFKFVQSTSDLGILTGLDEAVFKDITELEVGTLN